jgi:hypothetical protein
LLRLHHSKHDLRLIRQNKMDKNLKVKQITHETERLKGEEIEKKNNENTHTTLFIKTV